MMQKKKWHSSKLSKKTVLAAFKSARDQNKLYIRAKEQIAVIVEIKQNKNLNGSYSS